MTFTIGRVSIVQNPSQLELNGDRLDVGGWFFGTDLNQAKVLREQLIGLDGNEDEPDVPVTWTYDTKIDGYYTIKSVAVSHIMGVAYEDFKFQYAMTLQRVQGGYALPLCEVAASATLRTNAVSVTTGIGHVGVPLTSTFRAARFSDGQIANMFGSLARVSATGSVVLASLNTADPSFVAATFSALPGDYYDGAALIEQSVAGTYYPVVGNQISNVIGNLMRIGNGLVRATFHTDGVITSEIFDGTVWESSTSFSLLDNATNTWLAEGGWRILRNDAAGCTIRTSASSDANDYPQTVTLHVERGRMMFEIFVDNMFYAVASQTDIAWSLQLRANTVTPATALTGGIRQTSNNAQGHRWIMMSPHAVTNDLVNGRITIAAQSAPLIAQFGLGWELNGSASTSTETAAQIAVQYFGVTGTHPRVVSK